MKRKPTTTNTYTASDSITPAQGNSRKVLESKQESNSFMIVNEVNMLNTSGQHAQDENPTIDINDAKPAFAHDDSTYGGSDFHSSLPMKKHVL